MKVNFAFICYTGETQAANVLHTCVYENRPGESDMEHLIDELKTDPEFNMTDMVYGTDYNIKLAEGELLETLKDIMDIPDEL